MGIGVFSLEKWSLMGESQNYLGWKITYFLTSSLMDDRAEHTPSQSTDDTKLGAVDTQGVYLAIQREPVKTGETDIRKVMNFNKNAKSCTWVGKNKNKK